MRLRNRLKAKKNNDTEIALGLSQYVSVIFGCHSMLDRDRTAHEGQCGQDCSLLVEHLRK